MSPRLLTTVQAAAAAGVSVQAFRTMCSRARAAGVELRAPVDMWPDRRTPVYLEPVLRKWLVARPGKGRWATSRSIAS